MTRILLAIDETDASHAAAVAARDLFGEDAEYYAINVAAGPAETSSVVWGGVYAYGFNPPGVMAEFVKAPSELVDSARTTATDVASDAGIEADGIGAIGRPADAINRAAREHDVDAIVVGHHQRNWFTSLFDPSVSDDVVDAAICPVLVVPERT